MSSVTGMIKTLFSRKWWWVTLLVVLLMGVLFRLGIWQLDRLEERRAANAELLTVLSSPAVELAVAELPEKLDTFADRQVTATGQFDFDEQVLIKLQTWQGQPGIFLVAPLVFEDGSAVLVNRGWLPDAESDPAAWVAYDEPGVVTVAGFAALTQTLMRQTSSASAETTPGQFYRVDIDAIGADMAYELLPVFVQQTPDPAAEVALPYKAAQEIDLSEGPHLSYAIQWFIFCAGLGIAYVIFVRHSTIQIEKKEQQAHEAISAG